VKIIDESWIEPLYYGCLLTSCGGGESLGFLLQHASEILKESRVTLLEMEELPAGDSFTAVGIMGSMMEAHPPTGREGIRVLRRFLEESGLETGGLFTLEAASVNVLYPLLLAALTGLPLVDGDCMARAFPEFQMSTAHSMGINIAPMSIMTPRGHYFSFTDIDNLLFEVKTREIVSEEAGVAYFAGFNASAETLKRCIIPGTISFLYETGRCFLGKESYASLLEDLLNTTKNSLYGSVVELFIGTLTKRSARVEDRWRELTIEGVGNYKNSEFTILHQNEYLIGFRDRNIAVMVPDLIFLIDISTLSIVSLNDIHKGMKVSVLGMPAPVRLKSDSLLDLIGPGCFGYNNEYVPLEQLYKSYFF